MNRHHKRRDIFIQKASVEPDWSKKNINGCEYKQRYVSERMAQQQADYRSSVDNKAIRTYKCKLCKGWHLTSQPLPKKVKK